MAIEVLAVQGSPRKEGNTDILLEEAIRGAREEGARVKKVVLVDLNISPCLAIYACKKAGQCAIKDDMIGLYESIDAFSRMILASPIFFYSVSATAKAFIDRCQARWVRRYLLKHRVESNIDRKGAFIAVGATRGKRLFEGVRFTVRYFFDAVDMEYADELLVRGVDQKGEIRQHPEILEEAYALGRRIAGT